MPKEIHKEIKFSDLENILSTPEMKEFAAGAKMAFGTPVAPTKKKNLKSVSLPASTGNFSEKPAMKKKKPKKPKLIESDGLREALEKLIQTREKERKELLSKQRRLFQILAQPKGKRET